MYASIRGTKIYFDVEGSALVPDGSRMREKPVMFVLHGGPGADHTIYKPGLAPLLDKVQIVYIDHRGQGRSARGPKETYTLENNVEDVEALRQYLGLERIILMGASYGGMVTLSYAVRYSQHLSHLIASVTTSDYRFLERAPQNLAERGTLEQQTAAQQLWEGSFENDEQLREYFDVLGPMYAFKYDAEKTKEVFDRVTLSYEAINMGFGGFLRTYDITDQLKKITVPSLIIGGRHDWICPPEFSELIASKIPDADLHIFEESGHLVTGDEYDAFIDVVRGFLTYRRPRTTPEL